MTKTITIKGVGKASTRPDLIVVTMNLETEDKEYNKTFDAASKKIEELNKALEKVGFEKNSIKTTNFNVYTKYDNVKVGNVYKNVFAGYICRHSLKVEFDFSVKVLSQVLSAISSCSAEPELNIAFTVKDPSKISQELLMSASRNAKEKALVLCSASGATLGDLISIDYNWSDINVYSRTNYSIENKCLLASRAKATSIDFEPDDIKLTDSATFVWEIK